MALSQEVRVSKWYFGGLASAVTVCITHPLDLLKVIKQTQKELNVGLIHNTKAVLRNEGVLGLYNGLSASILRQLTYSTVRFGMYEVGKQMLMKTDGRHIPVYKSVLLAGISGVCGGVCGNPVDLVNVRMQNDMRLKPHQRRNYKNALHGVYEIIKKEGVSTLWHGAPTNCVRAAFMTVGQLVFYDYSKKLIEALEILEEGVILHFASSSIAGASATTLCQPIDVLKTRAMNAKPGEAYDFKSLLINTYREGGVKAFFRGYVPALIRIGPHTIILFLVLEQLRLRFGSIHVHEK